MRVTNNKNTHIMYNDSSLSKYFAPSSEVINACTECLFAASDTTVVEGFATLEDYEVFDLCE